MKTASSFGFGVTYATDSHVLLDPLPRRKRSDQRAIICLHGHNGFSTTFLPGWVGGDHPQYLADQGYLVLSIDAGGVLTWNNDTMLAAFLSAYNFLIALGIKGTKVGLLPWSMGGGNGLQIIKAHPEKIAAYLGFAPQTNTDYYCAPGGTPNAMGDLAYGGNYLVNSVGHKISDEYPTWRNKCPIKIVHGTADPTVPLSHSQAFVAGVNQPQVTLTEVAGGTHFTVFSGISVEETKDFFDKGYW